jgi:branched-chain amino acid transport system ATP-binding protein
LKVCSKAAAVAEPLLQISGLTKRFGGVLAADAISLDIWPGEVNAVIGPNGAGKTTLVSLVAGEITPQSGTVHFNGSDITRLPVYRRNRLGVARSFQITSLFSDLTAIENVALAVQAHRGHSFRFWRDARRAGELRKPALAAPASGSRIARQCGWQS